MIPFRRMKLRAGIKRAGGLLNQVGLAKRWDVSKQYVSKAVRHRDFPEPVPIEGDGEAWFGKEADAWRSNHKRTE